MKKTICFTLVLIMLVSLCTPAFAKRPEQPFKYYTSLGDSIGYHVENGYPYVTNSAGFMQYTYPCMVFDHFGLQEGYYGNRCGWRAVEALVALDPDYDGDDYTQNFLINWGGMRPEQIKAMSSSYIEGIKKADLITLNFGSNDLLGTFTYVTQKLMVDKTAGTALERATLRAIEKARSMGDMSKALDYLLGFVEEKLTGLVRIETIMKDITEAMAKFPTTWAKLIKQIRKLNPDAMIVAVSVYNPTSRSDIAFPLKETLIDALNFEMKSYAELSGEYIFVDVGLPDLTGTRDGSHLGNVGHREVADKIIAAVEKELPCDHSDTVIKNASDAAWWHLGYTGDLVCADCGKVLQCGEAVGLHLSPFKTPSLIASIRTFNKNVLQLLWDKLDLLKPY